VRLRGPQALTVRPTESSSDTFDGSHDLVYRQLVGVDRDGIVGSSQRCCPSATIKCVSMGGFLQHVGKALATSSRSCLLMAATRSLRRCRVEKDFQPGVWDDDGADITTNHHDAVSRNYFPLQRKKRSANGFMLRYFRYDGANVGAAKFPCDVFTVQSNVVLATVPNGWRAYLNVSLTGQFGQRNVVVRRRAASQRQVGYRSIENAGVEEEGVESLSDQLRNGRFAGSGRAVDGDNMTMSSRHCLRSNHPAVWRRGERLAAARWAEESERLSRTAGS
jgi:hypothetical protein